MNRHESEVCDDLDASVFSGDAFHNEQALREFENYLARWGRAVIQIQQMLDTRGSEE